jgi:hypothetical protein
MMLASNLEELTAAEQELDRIRRLLPVCAWCNRIRSEVGEWESIGTYLQREMQTDISHGLCPECEGNWEGRSRPPESRPGRPGCPVRVRPEGNHASGLGSPGSGWFPSPGT